MTILNCSVNNVKKSKEIQKNQSSEKKIEHSEISLREHLKEPKNNKNIDIIESDIDSFFVGKDKISFFANINGKNIEVSIFDKQNIESLMKDFTLLNSKKTEINSEISKINYSIENTYSHSLMENYIFITSESFALADNSRSFVLIIKKKKEFSSPNEVKENCEVSPKKVKEELEKNPFSLVLAFKDNKITVIMLTFVDSSVKSYL